MISFVRRVSSIQWRLVGRETDETVSFRRKKKKIARATENNNNSKILLSEHRKIGIPFDPNNSVNS